ncbi:MAG: hypothetical protein ACFFCW_19585 [Candidatus Hodarchaeota archaeon]
MNKAIACRIMVPMKYVGSLALFLLLILTMLPHEPETQSHPLNIHSNIEWLTHKSTGKIQAITDQHGTPITAIDRNETAYLVGTIFTGDPSYPTPLEIWGHIKGPGISPSFNQGVVFGKAQTDPKNDHKFVIPLQNGTGESIAFYRSLKGSYQIRAYVPGYDLVPTNLIIEPPGTWGAPDPLDIYAYSTIGVDIDGNSLSDAPYPVVRGQKFTVRLHAFYDDFSYISASQTAVDLTLQTPFNTEGWTETTKSIKSSTPYRDFSVGVPFDQSPGVYRYLTNLDHTTLSNTNDPYLKGNFISYISQKTFRVEVLETKEYYSKVDASGHFVVNPGTSIWISVHAWYLKDYSPLLSSEGLDLTLEGPFNVTNNSFRTTKTVYAPDHQYTFTVFVPINQSERKYVFRAILNHKNHTIAQEPLLRGQKTLYTSEKEFQIKVVSTNKIIRFNDPGRDWYIWRDQTLVVDGFVEDRTGDVTVWVYIEHLPLYLGKEGFTNPNGDFSVTFTNDELRYLPSGQKVKLWAESTGYVSENRYLVIQSSTTISIDSFDPDPGITDQTIHVLGNLKDDQGQSVGGEAIRVQVIGEEITESDYTSPTGYFDIQIVITGVTEPEDFTIRADYAGRVPYYTESSTMAVIRVVPITPPKYNIVLLEPFEPKVQRFRNESIMVQGQFQNDSVYGITPLPDMNIEVHLSTNDKRSIYITESVITDDLGNFAVFLQLNGSIPVGDFLIWADAPESGLDPTSESKMATIRSLTEIQDFTVQPLEYNRAYSGGEIQVNGTLVDDQKQSVSSVIITLNWEGEPPTTESSTDMGGQFSANLPVPDVPEETIRKIFAKYEVSEYYEATSAEYPVEITPYGPTTLKIAVNHTTVYKGETIEVTGNLRDQFGEPLPGSQTIMITWDGYPESISTTTNVNSDFSAVIQAPAVDQTDSYILVTTFSQIPGYQNAVSNKTIHIFVNAAFQDVDLRIAIWNESFKGKITPDPSAGVIYEKNINITVKGQFVDDLGNPINDRPLQIVLTDDITDKEVSTTEIGTDQKGEFSVTLATPPPGRYRFELRFIPKTKTTTFSTNTTTFTILKPPGPNLFTFALIDSFGILGGVIIAYFLHKKGLILATK